MLWLGWYFPWLPLECFGAAEAGVPLAVSRREQGREWIDRCNPVALELGVRSRMALPAALALAPGLRVWPRDSRRERQALEALGSWAWRYSSRIAFDPLLVLLEVGASLRLFGGFHALRKRMETELSKLGYHGQWSAAPTPAAAALLARTAPGSCLEVRSQLKEALAPIPLSHFTRNAGLLELMQDIGLSTIGDCLHLPRPELARRVGSEPARLLDRLLGQAPDPRPLWQPPQRFCQRLQLMAEIEEAGALRFPARRLIESLCAFLRSRDALAQRLEWRFLHRHRPATVFHLGLLKPGRDPLHLLELLQQRLERLELPAPVTDLELRVDRWQPFQEQKGDLFEKRQQGDGLLLERLRARLEETAVQGVRLEADHRPERAWRYCDPVAGPKPGRKASADHGHQPLWLLPQPRRLEERQGQPFHGGPLRLRPFGQRIETGWWDGDEVNRDYYQAVSPAGERLWIYRERKSGRWFLHGVFD